MNIIKLRDPTFEFEPICDVSGSTKITRQFQPVVPKFSVILINEYF